MSAHGMDAVQCFGMISEAVRTGHYCALILSRSLQRSESQAIFMSFLQDVAKQLEAAGEAHKHLKQ